MYQKAQQFNAGVFTNPTLRRLQNLSQKYYYFAASVLVHQGDPKHYDFEFALTKQKRSGRYQYRSDFAKFGDDLVAHTTVVAISKEWVHARLSVEADRKKQEDTTHIFILESTEWTPGRGSVETPQFWQNFSDEYAMASQFKCLQVSSFNSPTESAGRRKVVLVVLCIVLRRVEAADRKGRVHPLLGWSARSPLQYVIARRLHADADLQHG